MIEDATLKHKSLIVLLSSWLVEPVETNEERKDVINR